MATKENNAKNVALAIQNGADVNQNTDGYTPLINAIKDNNFEIVKTLYAMVQMKILSERSSIKKYRWLQQ